MEDNKPAGEKESALEKMRKLKKIVEDKRTDEEKKMHEEKEQKLQVLLGAINGVQNEIDTLNTTKQELLNKEKEINTERETHSGTIKAAVSEMAADPEVKKMVKADPGVKADIFSADTELLLKAREGHKEIKKQILEIETKIKDKEAALAELKKQTPEGKAEAEKEAIKSVEEKLPKPTFEKVSGKNTEYALKFLGSYNDPEMRIVGDTVKFKAWNDAALIPSAVNDVPKDILLLAYKSKIEEAMKNYDDKHEMTQKLFEDLTTTQENAKHVQDRLATFRNLQQEFQSVILQKKDEFKNKGQVFPEFPSGYDRWQDYVRITSSVSDNEIIQKAADYSDIPPQYDLAKFKDVLDKRIADVREYMEAIKALSSEADVRSFAKDPVDKVEDKSAMDKFHQARRTTYLNNPQFVPKASWQAYESLKKEAGSIQQATSILSARMGEQEILKQNMLKKLDEALAAHEKAKEVWMIIRANQMKVGGLNGVPQEIRNIELNKDAARGLLSQLTKIEMELPQNEELTLKTGKITVPSVQEALKDKKGQLEIKKSKQTSLAQQIENLGPKPSGLKLTFSSWNTEHARLTQEKEKVDEEIKELNDEYYYLGLQETVSINIDEFRYNTDVRELVEDYNEKKGTAQEIFKDLRAELNKILERKAPEGLMKASEEYAAMVQKLA